ncbi:Phytanoyl-CoA dioxygenase (PhyH) [Singulisphaera sp. GP187]|uniref:phytanoyl-CoA dioxygenase family protein n=1 Tax=Singulisphaera sp. GP187 TaxID=1882752 RepID=UPI000927C6EE|nr:phytanoyl-CoA dioxygenase family protein [Singulisphaera sp. GP187]SIO59288.1 Phytanoyl-CoA dioxygenase (PhyH) [Singulisphaera sp. GP187]
MVPEISARLTAPVGRHSELPGVLQRAGFAIVADLIDPRVISELIDAIDAIPPQGLVLERGGSVYAMRNVLSVVPASRALAESAPLTTLTRAVLGPGAFVVRGLLFDKTPEANWGVPWHQDLTIAVKARTDAAGYGPWTIKGGIPHVQPPVSVLERMLTVRVHLDDSDEERGPLRVVPGSHAAGRLGAEATRDWLTRVPPETCLVPRGGALLMRPLILHASSPAEASGRRRVIHLEYAAAPLPGDVTWFESELPGP